jgi:hypothetical protein
MTDVEIKWASLTPEKVVEKEQSLYAWGKFLWWHKLTREEHRIIELSTLVVTQAAALEAQLDQKVARTDIVAYVDLPRDVQLMLTVSFEEDLSDKRYEAHFNRKDACFRYVEHRT